MNDHVFYKFVVVLKVEGYISVIMFDVINMIYQFIKSILKSLVILAIWLALSGAIYSRIALFFALNRIFFSANENGTVEQNNQSDFKVSLK